jgi:hypothetical protein
MTEKITNFAPIFLWWDSRYNLFCQFLVDNKLALHPLNKDCFLYFSPIASGSILFLCKSIFFLSVKCKCLQHLIQVHLPCKIFWAKFLLLVNLKWVKRQYMYKKSLLEQIQVAFKIGILNTYLHIDTSTVCIINTTTKIWLIHVSFYTEQQTHLNGQTRMIKIWEKLQILILNLPQNEECKVRNEWVSMEYTADKMN